MEDPADGERREMTHQDLRIGGSVDGAVAADPLQSVRDRPCEERHMQRGRDGLQEIVYWLFLDRVDRDDGMAGLNQRFEIVCRVGVRHVREGAAAPTR